MVCQGNDLFDTFRKTTFTKIISSISIYIWKAYLEQQKIDSIYEANLRNEEWTYKTTKVPYDSIKVTHEGNVWTLEGTTTDDGISSETVYFDGDSIATTSNDEERLI